jgi:hypothetical protein
MYRFALLTIIPLSLATAAGAASGSQGDWPIHANSASSAGFSVVQVATTNAREFAREWDRPGAHGETHADTLVRRGQPIDTFIVFRGCRADPAGRCHVTATFEITAPDGKSQTTPSMDVWAKAQPAPGMIYCSQKSLGLAFAPAEPAGPYRVRAAVTDHVAGVTLHTQQVITLSK